MHQHRFGHSTLQHCTPKRFCRAMDSKSCFVRSLKKHRRKTNNERPPAIVSKRPGTPSTCNSRSKPLGATRRKQDQHAEKLKTANDINAGELLRSKPGDVTKNSRRSAWLRLLSQRRVKAIFMHPAWLALERGEVKAMGHGPLVFRKKEGQQSYMVKIRSGQLMPRFYEQKCHASNCIRVLPNIAKTP